MSKLLFLFGAIITLTACKSEAQINENGIINKVVSVAEFKKLLEQDDIQVIDVRTPEECSIGTIGNAININIYSDDFKAQLSKLDPNKTTLVYCAKGGRSAKAAAMMLDLKFVEVYDLRGGYSAWN